MSKRAHISLATKLAAAVACLYPDMREDAKSMTPAQFLSLFAWDHAELHAFTANDHFTNLTPMLILPHRAKSRKDTGCVAKVKRIAAADPEMQRILLKPCGHKCKPSGKIKSRSAWPKRSFPKRRKSASPLIVLSRE